MVAPRDGVARVVGAQPELHGAVLVGPPRMMVELFGYGGYLGHEGKGRLEISEAEGTGEGVVVFSPHGE